MSRRGISTLHTLMQRNNRAYLHPRNCYLQESHLRPLSSPSSGLPSLSSQLARPYLARPQHGIPHSRPSLSPPDRFGFMAHRKQACPPPLSEGLMRTAAYGRTPASARVKPSPRRVSLRPIAALSTLTVTSARSTRLAPHLRYSVSATGSSSR